MLTGCDNSSTESENSSTPEPTPQPTPEPTPEPSVSIPEAQNVSIRELYTSEILDGTYNYSDPKHREEGHSLQQWVDGNNTVLADGITLSINKLQNNVKVRYCVTPVTFDGISGNQKCSQPYSVQYSPELMDVTTDWSTDTDKIDDPTHGDQRESQSSNIHFFDDITLTPVLNDEYGLKTLTVTSGKKIDHQFYDGFDIDDIYADKDPSGQILLYNNTARTIEEPIVRVGTDSYYIVKNAELPPFTVISLAGLTVSKNTPLSFIDTSPAFKTRVYGFDQNPINSIEKQKKLNSYSIVDYREDIGKKPILSKHRESLKNDGQTLFPVSETDAMKITNVLLLSKIIYNRFDTIKLYFDSMNDFKDSNGNDLLWPFGDEKPSGICSAWDDAFNACGANNVVSKYAYRVQALTRLINHAPYTKYQMMISDCCYGNSDANADIGPGVMKLAIDHAADFNTITHENSHRLGYSDLSGIAYGWADELESFIKNMSFYYDGDILAANSTKPITEKSDFFADYNWVDSKTVDVHFFSKSNAGTIKNIAILAGDQESWLDYPNFYGTWATGDDISDYATYQANDSDGRLLISDVEKLNSQSIRIHLKNEFQNHAHTLFVFASSDDSSGSNGVWKVNYNTLQQNNFAVKITYDRSINAEDGHGNYFSASLSDQSDILRNGNSAHVGHNGESLITTPTYYIDGANYVDYSQDEAITYCKENGFADLGMLPFAPTSDSNDALANYVESKIYNGIIIGKEFGKSNSIQMVKTGMSPYNHPISTIVDDKTSRANMIICSK